MFTFCVLAVYSHSIDPRYLATLAYPGVYLMVRMNILFLIIVLYFNYRVSKPL